jgi:hypothetical protein
VRYLRPENGNLKKNALNKIESLCLVDLSFILDQNSSKNSEKNEFKVDAVPWRRSSGGAGAGEGGWPKDSSDE